MSKKILKALMQLFAVIASPESNAKERKAVVEAFLKQQLNNDLVKEYIQVFEYYFVMYQKKSQPQKKRKKRIAVSAVKILKICTEINDELTKQQKFIVLVLIFEFVKSGNSIPEQELEFVETVSDAFHIKRNEFHHLRHFILENDEQNCNYENILLIDNMLHLPSEGLKIKHLKKENLDGKILFFHYEDANMFVFKYIGSNELYINGQPIIKSKIYVLKVGSVIRDSLILPIYYSDIIKAYNVERFKEKILFEVDTVSYCFKNGKYGLNDISFTGESGNLIGIMGASGSGKTTLLNVLNGTSTPSDGIVTINGTNLHTQAENFKGLIGYVSQDDLLIEELTVFENLYYNAQLSFGDYSDFEIKRVVLKVLKGLGLSEIKYMKVGSSLNRNISGGQRKRLNIALELIREPSILFLDEPTSGLSSRDSENILDILKELALKGKLVMVVIHQPSSDIFKMFDKLIILDNGGHLIYSGNPINAITYFKSSIQSANWNENVCPTCGNVNPEQIFNIVESQVLNEYGSLTSTRKIAPSEWAEMYQEYQKDEKKPTIKQFSLPKINIKIPNLLHQFLIFVKRDLKTKLTNRQYLIINILETPLLAFLLAYIIRYYNVSASKEYLLIDNPNITVYIFMSVIVAIFIGLTVSAQEIIKDRKIIKREHFLNLSRSSYLFSKIAILTAVSALQALTFVFIGNFIIGIKGMYFSYWLVLFSTWVFANMLGLNISDSFRTSVAIYIIIPFLIIPQIILSGVIVNFDNLNPSISTPNRIPWYGEIMTARWAYEALAVHQFKDNEYEKIFYPYDKKMSQADFKMNYWLTNLKNKIAFCKNNLTEEDPEIKKQIDENFKTLKNELQKELNENPNIGFLHIENLTAKKLNEKIFNSTKRYLDSINVYYRDIYNSANKKKDRLTSYLENKEDIDFWYIKSHYRNENLADFVTGENQINRIVEYNNTLIQKNDLIYKDGTGYFVKAHFYAPRKQLFGIYFPTWIVNVIVIWAFSFLLFITLRLRTLKKLLDLFQDFNWQLKQKIKHRKK